jgi:hypothetical protein
MPPMSTLGTEPDDGPEHDELAYECSEWSAESRRLLASLLETTGVTHVWQGTTLSVRPEDESVVDALVDEVLAAARPALPDDGARVAYEVGDWPESLQAELAGALAAAGIPWEWDERGDLVVLADDEEGVEEVLAALPDPDDVDDLDDEAEGPPVHELLDRLFGAADKLVRRPSDAGALGILDEVVPALSGRPAPFGVDTAQWRALVEPAVELHLLAGGEEAGVDPDEVVVAARSLRDRLRDWV